MQLLPHPHAATAPPTCSYCHTHMQLLPMPRPSLTNAWRKKFCYKRFNVVLCESQYTVITCSPPVRSHVTSYGHMSYRIIKCCIKSHVSYQVTRQCCTRSHTHHLLRRKLTHSTFSPRNKVFVEFLFRTLNSAASLAPAITCCHLPLPTASAATPSNISKAREAWKCPIAHASKRARMKRKDKAQRSVILARRVWCSLTAASACACCRAIWGSLPW